RREARAPRTRARRRYTRPARPTRAARRARRSAARARARAGARHAPRAARATRRARARGAHAPRPRRCAGPPPAARNRASARAARSSRRLRQRRELLGLVLGHQARGELVEVAVHDGVDLVERETDAVVGHAPLREVVRADALGAVARSDQRLARGGFLGLLLTRLLVLDARGEHGERLLLVLVLRARVLAFHHDAGGQVRDAHGRIGLVDVLAAGTRRAEGIDAQLRRVEHDLA